jgi:hypothetical protein
MTDPIQKSAQPDAIEMLADVLQRNTEICGIDVFRPPVAALMQERGVLTEADFEIVERAKQLRDRLKLPFWDAAMLVCGHTDGPAPSTALFHAALHHNPSLQGRQRIVRDEFTSEFLRNVAYSVGSNEMVAVLSRVQLSNGLTKHIPMLDFHIGTSVAAVDTAQAVLNTLGLHGFLLHSGKSYHFYGDTLIEEYELVPLLARASLFGPIVDRAWIAHQIIEGACALRISPRIHYGGPPRLARRIG